VGTTLIYWVLLSTIMAKHSLIQRVQSYQDYYAAGDSHTARAKRLDISHFLDFLVTYRGYATRVKLTIHDWDKSSVERFVETKLLNGEAPSTVARRLATLKHMGRTLSEQIKDFKNPAKEVRAPKQSPLKPHSVSADELDEIKDYAEGRIVQRNGAFNRIRNRMLLLLLVDTGIRAEEARLLTRGQLTEDLEWLTNVRTKARRYRNVYITSEIRSDLADYLRHRAVELTRFYPRLPVTADNKLPSGEQ
jgi:site-specific recombinase XerD